jgi:hypothetical protein
MDSPTLRDAVATEFATTGAATPPWPDPHLGREGPRNEEYSRCLDPGKYRIVGARAEAWVTALAGLGLAVVEEVSDVTGAWRGRCGLDMNRATWLRPVRAGCLPMLVGFHHLQGVPDAVVHLGAGQPAVPLLSVPDCGCDACDDGSDLILEELDKHVVSVVSGAFVHVTTRHGPIAATGPEWSASGLFPRGFDFDALLTETRAGRSRHPVVRGGPWG